VSEARQKKKAEKRRIRERPFEHQLTNRHNIVLSDIGEVLQDIARGNFEAAANGLMGAIWGLGFNVRNDEITKKGT